MQSHNNTAQQSDTTHIKFANYARDFANAAEKLFPSPSYKTSHEITFNYPQLFLYSHSLELFFKSLLLKTGLTVKHVRGKYGHNLEEAYNALSNHPTTCDLITKLELYCQSEIQSYLRTCWGLYDKDLGAVVSSLHDNRRPSEHDIRSFTSNFSQCIAFLSRLHIPKTGLTRYPRQEDIHISIENVPAPRDYAKFGVSVITLHARFATQMLSEIR